MRHTVTGNETYKVLLVEDERWVRLVLREVLKETGLPFRIVQECGNGLEALDWLKENNAHLVLADVKMPVMDGLSFVEQASRLAGKPSVVFISGHDDFHAARQALRWGVVDYLLKPVEAEEMAAVLRRWMAEREKGGSSAAPSPAAADETSLIGRVLRIIHSSPVHALSLSDIAAKVHMNPSYLSQYFKQHTGTNFIDYIVGLRMEEARRLVASTTLRICEIAERLGYNDTAYFSNAFKKATGQTPLEYRKSGPKSCS
ncbi:helix-turn-helix domain-containing protein [Paenibacillus thailandensis]|uniref:Helix-turn-helix domain-containing protein n=1 Tax=Paenibacillus thailandensis TaxID=393250 RepID=A0ABW5R3C9_9BACL